MEHQKIIDTFATYQFPAAGEGILILSHTIPPGDGRGLSFTKLTKQLPARSVGIGHLLIDMR
jgi:hypothetical protein